MAAQKVLFSNFDPFFRTGTAPAETTSVTSLKLVLFGIRANESSGDGAAIIAGEDGVQNSFAVGEEVMPGVKLESVAFDNVTLSHNGAKELLYLDQSIPAKTVSPPATTAASAPAAPSPAAVAPTGLTAASLQQSIGFAPRNENGRVTGLVLSAKGDTEILTKAGFQPGDIVVALNGKPVSSMADLSSQLRPGARVTVEVERGANKMPIALTLEQ